MARYRTQNPDEFAATLQESGMAEKRAKILAHCEAGWDRQDIAEKFDISVNTVNTHYFHGKEDAGNAEALHNLLNDPPQYTALPDTVGKRAFRTIPDTAPAAFTFYRPVHRDGGLFDLQDAMVLEGHHLEGGDYLVVYYEPPGETSYVSINENDLDTVVIDWLITGRVGTCRPSYRRNMKSYVDRWFAGQINQPESLERALASVNEARIEPCLDDQFVDPAKRNRVNIGPEARTGPSMHGYLVGYTPTEEELELLVSAGRLDAEDIESFQDAGLLDQQTA